MASITTLFLVNTNASAVKFIARLLRFDIANSTFYYREIIRDHPSWRLHSSEPHACGLPAPCCTPCALNSVIVFLFDYYYYYSTTVKLVLKLKAMLQLKLCLCVTFWQIALILKRFHLSQLPLNF